MQNRGNWNMKRVQQLQLWTEHQEQLYREHVDLHPPPSPPPRFVPLPSSPHSPLRRLSRALSVNEDNIPPSSSLLPSFSSIPPSSPIPPSSGANKSEEEIAAVQPEAKHHDHRVLLSAQEYYNVLCLDANTTHPPPPSSTVITAQLAQMELDICRLPHVLPSDRNGVPRTSMDLQAPTTMQSLDFDAERAVLDPHAEQPLHPVEAWRCQIPLYEHSQRWHKIKLKEIHRKKESKDQRRRERYLQRQHIRHPSFDHDTTNTHTHSLLSPSFFSDTVPVRPAAASLSSVASVRPAAASLSSVASVRPAAASLSSVVSEPRSADAYMRRPHHTRAATVTFHVGTEHNRDEHNIQPVLPDIDESKNSSNELLQLPAPSHHPSLSKLHMYDSGTQSVSPPVPSVHSARIIDPSNSPINNVNNGAVIGHAGIIGILFGEEGFFVYCAHFCHYFGFFHLSLLFLLLASYSNAPSIFALYYIGLVGLLSIVGTQGMNRACSWIISSLTLIILLKYAIGLINILSAYSCTMANCTRWHVWLGFNTQVYYMDAVAWIILGINWQLLRIAYKIQEELLQYNQSAQHTRRQKHAFHMPGLEYLHFVEDEGRENTALMQAEQTNSNTNNANVDRGGGRSVLASVHNSVHHRLSPAFILTRASSQPNLTTSASSLSMRSTLLSPPMHRAGSQASILSTSHTMNAAHAPLTITYTALNNQLCSYILLDFTMRSVYSTTAASMHYFIFRSIMYFFITLLLCFCTSFFNVLSTIYLLSSFLLLSLGDDILKGTYAHYWDYLYLYNYTIILLRLLYQLPVFHIASDVMQPATIIGFYKVNYDDFNYGNSNSTIQDDYLDQWYGVAPDALIMDILIFCVILVQRTLLCRKEMLYVRSYLNRQTHNARDRSEIYELERQLDGLKRAYVQLKEEQQRIDRLEYVRSTRFKRDSVFLPTPARSLDGVYISPIPARSLDGVYISPIPAHREVHEIQKEVSSTPYPTPVQVDVEPQKDVRINVEPATSTSDPQASSSPSTSSAQPAALVSKQELHSQAQDTKCQQAAVTAQMNIVMKRLNELRAKRHRAGLNMDDEIPQLLLRLQQFSIVKKARGWLGVDDTPHTDTDTDAANTTSSKDTNGTANTTSSKDSSSTNHAASESNTISSKDTSNTTNEPSESSAICCTTSASTEDSSGKTVVSLIWDVAAAMVLSNTEFIVCVLILCEYFFFPSILTLLYPVSLFLFGLLVYPRPPRLFWIAMIGYTCALILTRFIFQFPLFCICTSVYSSSYQLCSRAEFECCDITDQSTQQVDIVAFAGLYKAEDRSEAQSGRFMVFVGYAILDFLVLFFLLLHRRHLKAHGIWTNQPLYLVNAAAQEENARVKQLYATEQAQLSREASANHPKPTIASIPSTQPGQAQATINPAIDPQPTHATTIVSSSIPSYNADNKVQEQPAKSKLKSLFRSQMRHNKSPAAASSLSPSQSPPSNSIPATSKSAPAAATPSSTSSMLRRFMNNVSINRMEKKLKKSEKHIARLQQQLNGNADLHTQTETLAAQHEQQQQGIAAAPITSEEQKEGNASNELALPPTSTSSPSARIPMHQLSRQQMLLQLTLARQRHMELRADIERRRAERKQNEQMREEMKAAAQERLQQKKQQAKRSKSHKRNNKKSHKKTTTATIKPPNKYYMKLQTALGMDATKAGKDFYIYIFTVQLLQFIILVIFYNLENNAGSLTQNYISPQFVLVIFAQFVHIILERTAYLYRSMIFKLLLQLATMICFFIITLYEGFTTVLVHVVFVLLCLYWMLSCLQCYYGFPASTQGQFLTRGYEAVRALVFKIYRAIPFVFELRTLLDWTCAATVLKFTEWLKLEDIYATFHLAQCEIESRKRDGYSPGTKMSWVKKILVGLCLFLLLILVVWFPLFLFASPNATGINPVQHTELSVTMPGYSTLYSTQQSYVIGGVSTSTSSSASDTIIDDNTYTSLLVQFPFLSSQRARTLQVIYELGLASQAWSTIPATRTQMMNDLLNSTTVPNIVLLFQFIFTRSSGTAAPITTFSSSYPLSFEQREAMAAALNQSNSQSISLPGCYPAFYYMSSIDASGSIDPLSYSPSALSNCSLSLNSEPDVHGTMQDYWLITDAGSASTLPSYASLLHSSSPAPPIYMYSGELPNTGSLNYGLIGIYITVVLTIGRFVRMYVMGQSKTVMYEDMQDATPVTKMVEDVYSARLHKQLVLEEELYVELISVLRSPDTLRQLTGPYVHCFPRAREEERRDENSHSDVSDVDDERPLL